MSGCLWESGDSQQAVSSEQPTQSGATSPSDQTPPPTPTQQSVNRGPLWQPSPTIEFVEGVPSMVSVREFVNDPDRDALTIRKESGSLLPGITWDPSRAILAYDGRPLGAKPGAPVAVTGLTFSADDGKR